MVTKAKETLEQYNKVRSEGREKLQPLFDEKNKRRNLIKEAFWVWDVELNFEAKKAKKLVWNWRISSLNAEWKEKHKDIIAKYQGLFAQKKIDEERFQQLFSDAKKWWLTDLDEETFRAVISWEESKEKQEKSLEFEKDTFKISSEWWEEVTKESAKKNPALKKFLDKGIKVKANATWDVVEYMEDKVNWALTCKKWEQIFITYDAFIREVCKAKNCSKEVAESKYMMTIEELKKKMEDKPDNSEEYKKFFNEEVNGLLAGYWTPYGKIFYDVAGRSRIWLVGGDDANFNQDEWSYSSSDRDFGFSGRLLKN